MNATFWRVYENTSGLDYLRFSHNTVFWRTCEISGHFLLISLIIIVSAKNARMPIDSARINHIIQIMLKETFLGFKQFILKGNAVDLAVGIVIGASFSAVVNALVKDLITPFIAAIGGEPDFSMISFTINNSKFLIGDFLNVFIAFVINAAVIYFLVVTPMNRFLANVQKNKKTLDPTSKKCTECLSEIPLGARRCAFCTSVQKSK